MEILIIIILTFLNGFFALSEIALVSVKKSRIEHLVAQGNQRAKTILKLLENPENFLSSVQVGITLIGIVSGAYGGVALTDNLEAYLLSFGFSQAYTHITSLVMVISSITYFSIVIGELVPKSIAMNNAEGIALTCAPIVHYFTMATYPFVKLLSISTNLLLKLFGIKENAEEKVSEKELFFMLKTAGNQGVLEAEESQVHQNLFYFTDQTAKSLMTHSTEIEWLDNQEDMDIIFHKLQASVHSKFIVGNGSLDNIEGIIYIKDFLENYQQKDFKLSDIIKPPIVIPQNIPAFKILNLFKSKKQYLAIVIDEFGVTQGIITLHDLIEAIVGDLPDEDESDELNIVKRADGSYLLNGKTIIYELNQFFQREIIKDNLNQYTTISGFILDYLKTFPKEGDSLVHKNFKFEIIDMDGIKIDKILMTEID